MKTIEGLGRTKVRAGFCALALGGAVLAVGCGDDTETGAGGAGGEGTSSSSSGSPASTSTDVGPGGGEGGVGDGGAASGTGGDGGSGGSGTGGDGAGGTGAACLDGSAFADLFTLDTERLCVVALYDAPGWDTSPYGVQPTWGRHGGPLTGAYFAKLDGGPITSVELTRWSVPDGATGELVAETSEIELVIGDEADFGGSQILDIGEVMTVFAFSGQDFKTEGGIVAFGDNSLDPAVSLVLGVTGMAPDPITELPVVSALAAPGDAAIDAAGLYGAESCKDGSLCEGSAYSLWGDATGPVAADREGNVFAIMTSLVDGTQTARGFGGGDLTEGEPVNGVDMFTVDGFGLPLAAIGPTRDHDGILVFQATSAVTFAQEPAILTTYAQDGGSVFAAAQEPLLTPTVEGAPVSLVSDDDGRIWVGVGAAVGTRFAVLARP